jgi:toxin ParE1/3/4
MQIVWLPKALENLKDIKAFIDKESPKSAKMVATKIKNTVSFLQDNPHMGKLSLVDGFREIPVPNLPFIIPYKVVDDKIVIVRVFHTKQKPINWNV